MQERHDRCPAAPGTVNYGSQSSIFWIPRLALAGGPLGRQGQVLQCGTARGRLTPWHVRCVLSTPNLSRECKEKVFLVDPDRELLLDVLARVVERFNWRCHAYCQNFQANAVRP